MSLQVVVPFGILSHMKELWKLICSIFLCLLLIALPGCRQQATEAYPEAYGPLETTLPPTAAPDTPAPTVLTVPITMAPTFTPTPTPTATPVPTPTPTATPEPTPTPTPTSVPLDRRDFEGEVREILFPLWEGEPEPTPTVEPLATPDPRVETIGKLCAMVFANVAVYDRPNELANVLGRESYHLLYVHSIHRDFYYVTTQEGRKGYVKTSQVTPLSSAALEAFLSASMQSTYTAALYSPDAFIEELMTVNVRGGMEERVYAALCRLGFDFEPYYYRVYQKDLQDNKKYPRFYKEEVYNSLLFKLFNSTGSLAYYEGQRTQWEYVPVNGTLQRGDILFFSELPKRSNGVIPGCEFVIAGQHSGNITDCAVYLGDDSILCLQDGRVERLDGFSTSLLSESFDSARRIHLDIFDEKQMIIEDLIAQAYDCLGTPYNNYQRCGDFSFDCSGLISWLLLRTDLYPARYAKNQWTESSASGLSNLTDYIWKGEKRVHMGTPVPVREELKSLDGFERGDIVFLLRSKGGNVGHVMLYLGDGRVIHSTRVVKAHQVNSGTVIANFRKENQNLYFNSLRIESIT